MTQILINTFIKNSEDIENLKVRAKYGVLAGIVGIICNVLLCISKIAIGLISSSVAIMADGLNNLSDAASSIVSIVSFKMASKEPDSEHPFGHGRIEYIAGLIVAFMILLVGYELIQSSIAKIINPQPVEFSFTLIIVLVLSIIIKLWMGGFNRKIGKAINSAMLIAVMQDSINDAISTFVVLISAIIADMSGLLLDGYVGLIVALFIIYSGIKIAKETLDPLLGLAVDPEISQKIEEILLHYEDIKGVHDLIVHNYGEGKNIASIHVEVADNCDFVKVHEVIDAAEKLVWRKTGVYIVIHMDPICLDDERVLKIRQQLEATILKIDDELSMHDFRIVDGDHNINLIFDIVVSYDYTQDKKEELIKIIEQKMKRIDNKYSCVITIDHKM